MTAQVLRPDWPAPPGVHAALALRGGGTSAAPFDSLNLSFGVGDTREAVLQNRARFTAALGAAPVWMRQVHGADVVRLGADALEAPMPTADAAWTSEPGIACAVGAADCLPVLFTLPDGSAVGAAHAGWRGLAAGVLEATVQAMTAGSGAASGDLLAWLGPRIGPRQFEVGADVLAAFGADPAAADHPRFVLRPRPDGEMRWLADLAGLARDRLQAAGVTAITDCGLCTVEDPSRFFSFRRDRVTGRMAAAIWRE